MKIVSENPFEGFHRLSREERLSRVKKFCRLTDAELEVLSGDQALPWEIAENLVENVIGYFSLPLGLATNFHIDGRDVLIPMAVEETSIIAAASATAKWVKKEGSIRTHMKGSLIIGQIQLPRVDSALFVRKRVHEFREELMALGNSVIPGLVNRGGGVRDLSIRELVREDQTGTMMVIHVFCDPCDAMGANIINQVCEAMKPRIEEITCEKVGLCILSNLIDSKLTIAEVVIRAIDPIIGAGIVEATQFAKTDPYRATTHNKGVLNGIDPILIATGNDWRAVEAGIHSYACRSGKVQPTTEWWMENNDLHGRFEAPLPVGTVGGVTRVHPTAKVALKILGITKAEELARICAAVGLVQNLGALKALSTVGIVKGHMQLHAANLAIAAGADHHEIERVRFSLAEILKTEKYINLSHAQQVLETLRGQ